jgi:hypothetical protein
MKLKFSFRTLNDKQLAILLAISFLVLLILVLAVYYQSKSKKINNPALNDFGVEQNLINDKTEVLDHPEFMEDSEKESFSVSKDLKIQIIKRGADGKTEVYKIIKDDSEIIADPREIKAIQPISAY